MEDNYENIMKECVKQAQKDLNEKGITHQVRLLAYKKFAKAIKES